MEAKVSEQWPKGEYVYEPKWDGFRSISWSSPESRIDSRNQRPLLRYFPELAPALEQLPEGTVVDGEIVVVIDGATDFDALQQRIHPAASRIKLLSEQTPSELIAFDLLAHKGEDLRERPFRERRERLVELHGSLADPWHLTPQTDDQDIAKEWFDGFESAGCDGIVAKNPELEYQHGKRAMIKIKHRRTVDCVVGGFRYASGSPYVGSLLLGLYDSEGRLDHVGFTATITHAERPALTKKLEALIAPPGFTGKAPGGPSRWSTERSGEWEPLKPKLVVEVRYDHVTDNRFRHGTKLVRFRPDKAPKQCTFEQLAPPALPRNIKLLLK